MFMHLPLPTRTSKHFHPLNHFHFTFSSLDSFVPSFSNLLNFLPMQFYKIIFLLLCVLSKWLELIIICQHSYRFLVFYYNY